MYEPPRRLIYRMRSAAEVLGYSRGAMQNLMKLGRIESWPYGAIRRFYGRPTPVYRVMPHRAIRQNLEHRGATHYLHPEPVWKPIYTAAETKVLLDLSDAMFRRFTEEHDLEVAKLGNGHHGRVTRLSIDALLERWEAGELSDLEPLRGELPEHKKAVQFRAPLRGPRTPCGWCGKFRYNDEVAIVAGRKPYRDTTRLDDRRVCRRCVEARVATVREVRANGRPGWVDDAWVHWSAAADALGVSYEGLEPSLQAAIKAGTAKWSDFRGGGALWTDKLERKLGEPVPEPEPSDDEWEWEPPDIEAAVDEYEAG